MISNAKDLTERLRRRLETERREIEELTASELERLGENSRRVARNALRTIERDTAAATARMRALLLKAWLRPLERPHTDEHKRSVVLSHPGQNTQN